MTTRMPPASLARSAPSRGVTSAVVHAGFWRQIAALLLDSLLLMSVTPVVAWLAFLAAMIGSLSTQGPADSTAGVNLALLAVVMISWLLMMAYHALFDASAMQATPGKRMLGIKVVDADGARIGMKQAWLRAVLLSPPLTIGYLLVLFDRRKRGMHDVVADTLVVDRWAWTATPDQQSPTANRTAAWIGVPVALVLGFLLVAPRVDGWLKAGAGRVPQDVVAEVEDWIDSGPGEQVNIDAPVATDAEPHGMTWGLGAMPAQAGVSFVGCHGHRPFAATVNGSCDAYIGDTACSTVLPALCLRPDQRPAPDATLRGSWVAGEIALAPAVAGSIFRSQAGADAFCSANLGTGWRLAEHHDGGGWQFHAAGTIPPGTRFWVANNDMPANCWNSKPRPRTDAEFRPGSPDAPQLEAQDVRFTGTVKSFDGGCWSDGACSIVVGNRKIYLPSPRQDGSVVVKGHVEGLPQGEEAVGRRVEVHCNLLRGACSLEGREDYYIRLLDD